jgi:hypothetical protein
MIYILNIGYYSFAFENARGLDTVLRTLEKGMRITRDYKEDSPKVTWKRSEENVEVKIETDSTVSITKGKGRASWQPERVVVTPEVMRDEFFCDRSSPRQIAGSKCLQAFRNKSIRGHHD